MSRPIGGRPWADLRKRILDRDHWQCRYCGRDLQDPASRPQVDHIVPRQHGGTDDPSNLAAACGRCNRDKADLSVEEFLARRGEQRQRPARCKASRQWTDAFVWDPRGWWYDPRMSHRE